MNISKVHYVDPTILVPNKDNPRLKTSYDHILDSVVREGIKEPLMVVGEKCDHLVKDIVMKGHCRLDCVLHIKNNPETVAKITNDEGVVTEVTYAQVYKDHFAQGVPVRYVNNATYTEIVDLHIDHGDSKPLTNKFEAYMAACMLFDGGFTDFQVANKLAVVLDTVLPPKTGVIKELNDLKNEGSTTAYFKRYGEYRRGVVQNFKRLRELPEKVAQTMKYLEGGEKGDQIEHLKDEQLPLRLTYTDVMALHSAFTSDKQGNKARPGDNFNAKWSKLILRGRVKDGDPAPKKPMKPSEITEQSKKLGSMTLKTLCKVHTGEPDVDFDAVIKLDDDIFLLEMIKQHDPDFYNQFKAHAEELVKKQQEINDAAIVDDDDDDDDDDEVEAVEVIEETVEA